jgi:hypothetical protein
LHEDKFTFLHFLFDFASHGLDFPRALLRHCGGRGEAFRRRFVALMQLCNQPSNRKNPFFMFTEPLSIKI